MPYVRDYATSEPAPAAVEALPGITMLEFGAPWCGFCIGAQRALEEVLGRHPGVRHLKIEDGRGRPLGRAFRVKLWPTLVLLREGVEVARAVRPAGASEIEALLARPAAR